MDDNHIILFSTSIKINSKDKDKLKNQLIDMLKLFVYDVYNEEIG